MAELADFRFMIKYRPEKVNADADGLSRMPLDIDGFIGQCTKTVSQDAFSATQQVIEIQQAEGTPLFSALLFTAIEE